MVVETFADDIEHLAEVLTWLTFYKICEFMDLKVHVIRLRIFNQKLCVCCRQLLQAVQVVYLYTQGGYVQSHSEGGKQQ